MNPVTLQWIRRALEPAIRRVLHVYWRFARGLTLGVRGLIVDDAGRIFLVEHSYIPGWHLPGGGVEVGETLTRALTRELREEGNIELTGPAELFAVYHNSHVSRRDHVALYVIRAFRQPSLPRPNGEIIAHGFFPLSALPEGTSRATRARIAEVLDARPVAEIW
jgi:ADP-ribose pyrophosphatase YjhB (NUDIX family)